MAKRRPPAKSAPAPLPTPTGTAVPVHQSIVLHALDVFVGKAFRLYAALFLAIGGLVLMAAWQHGPQRLLDADEFKTLTARHTGQVVESWLALDMNEREIKPGQRWRAFARATPCAVIEYDGEWGPARRAFCGNRLPFYEHYTLHDLTTMAPRVPFDWARDSKGMAAPEIRMPAAAVAWLAKQPADNFFIEKAKPASALEDLQIMLDRPVDIAVRSWGTLPPKFPLALDPKRPEAAMPLGFIEERAATEPNWGLTVIGGFIGLVAWFSGINIFLRHLVPIGRIVLGTVPLLLLPWWGDAFPRFLRSLNADVGSVAADMIGDIDITGRLTASDPGDAVQAGGERLAWTPGKGRYADTFGKLQFVLPKPRPADMDVALAALTDSAAAQVRAMPASDRQALFERLQSDKQRELRGAGLVFVPAAREAVLDSRADEGVRRAAASFLSEWVTQPVEEVLPTDAGRLQRLKILRDLTTLPIPIIANPAGWILERGEKQN